MSTALYSRQRRLEKKRLGLCYDCLDKAEVGFSRCRSCLDKDRVRVMRYVTRHKTEGLCVRCGSPAFKSRVTCAIHHYAHLQASRDRYSWNKEEKIGKAMGRYKKLKTEGRCVSCGMPLNDESRMGVMCLTCYSRRSGYN